MLDATLRDLRRRSVPFGVLLAFAEPVFSAGCSGTVSTGGEREIPAAPAAMAEEGATGTGGAGMRATATDRVGGDSNADADPSAGGGGALQGEAGAVDETGGTAGMTLPPDEANGVLDSESEPEPEVCDAVTEVLVPSCGGSGCHQGVGIGNFGVGEEEAVSYVDKSPVSNVGLCGLMIDSNNPARSMILTKVTGGAPYNEDDCKQLMPPNRALPQDQVDCLRSWIQQFQR